MNEMQQFGEVTVIDWLRVALDRFGLERPDHSSAAQVPQKIGSNTPQEVYQAGFGWIPPPCVQTVWTDGCEPVPAGEIVLVVHPETPLPPASNPPLVKQLGVPMHGDRKSTRLNSSH